MGDDNQMEILSFLLQKQNEIIQALKPSALAEKVDKDVRPQFWKTYEFVAEEVDSEFLGRYNEDIDIIPTFQVASLFSAITTSYIIASQPNPQDTTNALLTQLILLIANGTSAP